MKKRGPDLNFGGRGHVVGRSREQRGPVALVRVDGVAMSYSDDGPGGVRVLCRTAHAIWPGATIPLSDLPRSVTVRGNVVAWICATKRIAAALALTPTVQPLQSLPMPKDQLVLFPVSTRLPEPLVRRVRARVARIAAGDVPGIPCVSDVMREAIQLGLDVLEGVRS